MEANEQNWYVNIDGTIHEVSGNTVDQWIWDGTVLAHHPVSKKGVSWMDVGKTVQFAHHFKNARQDNESAVLQNQHTTRVRDEDVPTPVGLKISLGSAAAVVVALLAGYFWAFHIIPPPGEDAFKSTHEVRGLEADYYAARNILEDKRHQLLAAPALKKAADAPELRIRGAHEIGFRKAPAVWSDAEAAGNREELKDIEAKLLDMDVKYTGERKQTVSLLQKADARSRFYRSFVLCFLILGGFNLFVFTVLSGKKKVTLN